MNDELNNLLKKWAARRSPSQERLDRLADQIRTEAARTRYADHKATLPVIMPFWSKLGYAATGAAVVMIVFVLHSHWLVSGRSGPIADAQATAIATVGNNQLAVQTRLFSEVQRMFNDRLRWIAQSNGDVGIGVESETTETQRNPAPFLVRLVVVSRTVGENTWRPVWSTDVILRGEDMVEIVPNSKQDNSLALWVYPLKDGRIAVDTSLSLSKPVQLASKMNTVVQRGQPSEIVSLRTGDVEYKVFQTIQSLNIEKNG